MRRRRSPWIRLRPFWIAGILVAGVALWGAAKLARLPAFELKQLDVNGLSHVSRSDVLAHAAIDPRTNIWLMNGRALEARIETIPYVSYARVERWPLAHVTIEISERAPDACVRDSAGAIVTIDRSFRVLEVGCAQQATVTYALHARCASKPGAFLNDAELRALESDARALGAGVTRFRAFAYDRYGDLDATMRNGIAVNFGDDGELNRKDRLIGSILTQLGARAQEVVAIDLRASRTPVVRYRADCVPCTAPI